MIWYLLIVGLLLAVAASHDYLYGGSMLDECLFAAVMAVVFYFVWERVGK